MNPTSTEAHRPDPTLLEVLRPCIEHHEVGEDSAEWPNNIISRLTVVYASGAIARRGDPVPGSADPAELDLCRRLSSEVARLMKGVEVGMGSNASSGFEPFFIAANTTDPLPSRIDEALVRARFGGTLFPLVTLTVEPLVEAGQWWSEVEEDGAESSPSYFEPWRKLIAWCGEHGELHDPVFVRIGHDEDLWKIPQAKYPRGTELTGGVLPRLPLALTRAGSLVGLFGYAVQT